MASRAKRLDTNAPGTFFVDASCIDCETCRWVAPASFDGSGDRSRVYHQPATAEEIRRAEMALVACPVAAIGSEDKRDLAAARAAFPDRIDGDVYHCGWHSEASFGAASYLIVREAGNIMVDSPRFARPLAERIAALGGIEHIFLTHIDDVADHKKWAAEFGASRILHADDMRAHMRGVEIMLDGSDPIAFDDEVTFIPVPGHTRGSVCLNFRETYLFSGDHVSWSPRLKQIYAFRGVCWYDWRTLVRSMERLARHRFEWILPGHGYRCHFPDGRMDAEMARCLAWLREAA
jgi:glyoxylase-like metal-dependent hydrolase (beta-lactamase superfamily II)/ferredoxin